MAIHGTTMNFDLTPMQRRFIEEYLQDPSDQSKAAIRAGYAAGSAAQTGSKLMADPRVQAEIEKQQGDRSKRLGITHDRVLQELWQIVLSNPKDLVDPDGEMGRGVKDLNREQAAALEAEFSVTVLKDGRKIKTARYKQRDKVAALQLIGKHLGMFKDKVEVEGHMSLEQLIEASMKPKAEEAAKEPQSLTLNVSEEGNLLSE